MMDGGPAFPTAETERYQAGDGMSLLDYFAGQALAGMMANEAFLTRIDNANAKKSRQAEEIGWAAYAHAAAMLIARAGMKKEIEKNLDIAKGKS